MLAMDVAKVVVLGAPQVGKSTLIEQFVQRAPSECVTAAQFQAGCDSSCTLPRRTFYPAVQLNDRLLSLRLHDLPSIETFPSNSDHEWRHFRALGLRSAAAYVLVFDASAPDTFGYLRSVRQQLQASRGLHRIPVVVVANKHDRAAGRQMSRAAREMQTVVRKLWKWPYVECSAKYNCQVLQVFRELTVALSALEEVRTPPALVSSPLARSGSVAAISTTFVTGSCPDMSALIAPPTPQALPTTNSIRRNRTGSGNCCVIV